MASRKDGGGKSRTTGLAKEVVGAREFLTGVKGVAQVVGSREVMEFLWLKEMTLVLGGAT